MSKSCALCEKPFKANKPENTCCRKLLARGTNQAHALTTACWTICLQAAKFESPGEPESQQNGFRGGIDAAAKVSMHACGCCDWCLECRKFRVPQIPCWAGMATQCSHESSMANKFPRNYDLDAWCKLAAVVYSLLIKICNWRAEVGMIVYPRAGRSCRHHFRAALRPTLHAMADAAELPSKRLRMAATVSLRKEGTSQVISNFEAAAGRKQACRGHHERKFYTRSAIYRYQGYL